MRHLGALALALAACSSGSSGNDPSMPSGAPLTEHDPEAAFFNGMPTGEAQLKILCARGSSDAAARGLCARPNLDSLVALERAVGLLGQPQPPQLALTGHSTSLVARSVSAINPRAIVFTAPTGAPSAQPNDGSFVEDPGFVALGFVRGEQLAEIAAHDPQTDQIHFYLIRYTQPCNRKNTGCTNGDLLTPAVEKNWRGWNVYEDVDLADTVFDCMQCHQPDGPGTRKILRMQERRAPWTHWLRNNQNQPGGETLLADFQAAHGTNEDYAGIPAAFIDTPRSDPLVLEALVDNNSLSPQPNEFNTQKIEQQVTQSAPAQPSVNLPMGQSAAWQQIFAVSQAGNAIPVPYHDVKITDPGKLAQMTSAYRAVAGGQQPLENLPDIRDVILDEALPDLGMRAQPGATGQQILQQMCQRCHNDKLDQSLARARFDVTKLATLPQSEKDAVIARIQLPSNSPKLMPPARFSSLTSDEIATVVAMLKN
jgi:mono/diheme cytochrome c family protein